MKKALHYAITAITSFTLAGSILSCGDSDLTIKMKGSDTEVNLAVNLAEEFAKTNSEFSIAISGGGSGLGIASLLNGQADIANSSRPLKEEEVEMFQEQDMEIRSVVFAEDATAFVVNGDNPLEEIDVNTLAKIMSGEITSWNEVVDWDMPINIYGRQSSSGTHSFIKNKLGIEYSPEAKEMSGNAQILEGIKVDKTSIGYVGAGYISKEMNNGQEVKVLMVRENPGDVAYSPLDAEAILNKRYFFQRPLYQFIRADSWDKVQPFIQYETKGGGRKIIKNSGYYLSN